MKYIKGTFQKTNSKVLESELPEFVPFQEHVKIIASSSQATHYRVFIDKGIDEPSKYSDLIQALISANDNDMFEFLISCDGGNLDSCVSIVNALNNTNAYTRAVITSHAHSAASIISLVCDEVVAMPHTAMLVHQPRGGSYGRYIEQVQQGHFNEKMIRDFFTDVYEGFLTPSEIDSVLQGKDIWLSADEINERAKKRSEWQEKEQKRLMKEIERAQKQKETSVEKPKKTSKNTVAKEKIDDTIIAS